MHSRIEFIRQQAKIF